MRRYALSCVLITGLAMRPPGEMLTAQNAPPGTDIYLAPLSISKSACQIGHAVNLTLRRGYDNQPAFTEDGRSLLYTSIRNDSQADIYRVDLRSRRVVRVTTTPESEYSPIVYGDGRRFSVVRVEGDSTQRLWSFRLDGSDPRVVLDSMKPVGYHAWLDDHTVALFVLGRPNILRLADTRTGRSSVVAQNIGRSLVTIAPLRFSYVQLGDGARPMLTEVKVSPGSPPTWITEDLVEMPAGSDYVVWLDTNRAVAGQGSKLLLWQRGAPGWRELVDLSTNGVRRISRLALSPGRQWIAIVAADGP